MTPAPHRLKESSALSVRPDSGRRWRGGTQMFGSEAGSMRHPKTKQMLAYWLDLFETAARDPQEEPETPVWPERRQVQPSSCRQLLGDMFILERQAGAMRYRLAGTRLCALFDRELKGSPFSALYDDRDRDSVESWALHAGDDGYVGLLASRGETLDGRTVTLETLLMPLNFNGKPNLRLLGLTVAAEPRNAIPPLPLTGLWLRSARGDRPWIEHSKSAFGLPAEDQAIGSARHILQPHAVPYREVQHLRVIDGGKSQ